MKDILTKKRVKVDYEAIISLLGLFTEFRYYQINKHSLTSQRRQMYAFLHSQNVDFYACSRALKDGCKNMCDLVNYCGSYKAAMEFAYGL